MVAAVLLLGAGPVASAADPGASPTRSADAAGPVDQDASANQLRVAAYASPALHPEPLTAPAHQERASAPRNVVRPPEATPGVSSHLAAIAGGLLVLALVVAGAALTVAGLREDLRKRRRGYRRRSRRIHAPIQRDEKRAISS